MQTDYYLKSVEETEKVLETSKNGLTDAEAKQRLQRYGFNQLVEKKKINPFFIFLRQFHSIVVYILIGAVIISIVLGEYISSFTIIGILIFNAFFGFVQEYKAEKAIEALKKLTALKAKVLRDGKLAEINAKELVLGDIILFEEGDKISADMRIIEELHIKTQEAALTGESQAVEKQTGKLSGDVLLGEQSNMAFSGTIIVSGRGKGIVVATGMQTQIGKIARIIEETEENQTPLQQKLDKIGKQLGYGAIIICLIVFATAAFKGADILQSFLTAVALAVAAVPEGLPAVITISLALGVRRMIKKNAIIRKLPCVETLGSTTVICADKTGTLTKNEMTVRQIYMNKKVIEVTGSGYKTVGEFYYNGKKIEPKELYPLLKIGALNNNAQLDSENVVGDPTEGALIVSAHKAKLSVQELEKSHQRIDEILFNSQRKRMSTIHIISDNIDKNNKLVLYTKGAPDVIVHLCNRIYINGKIRPMTAKDKKDILEMNHKFSSAALRVLGFAYKELKKKKMNENNEYSHEKKEHYTEKDENNLIFVGLQGMIDPPRDEAKSAVQCCKEAGIRVIMITGDYETTAMAIGRELGIGDNVMNGNELSKCKNLEEVIDDIDIFARVNPEDKLKIVEALQKKGNVVAMTGDGVNDAPALKKAEIGIAMGVTGTEVSKEASDMVLRDDNFASIVNAVEEGRGIYNNIKKYFAFLLSGNISEVLIIFIITILGFPVPLVAAQILLINLVTDGFPALALSVDPFEQDIMKKKPRKKDEPLYKGLSPYLIFYPIIMTIAALGVFSYIYLNENNIVKAQTMTFLLVCMFELFQSFSCRSTSQSSIKAGLFKNKWLILAVALSAAIAFMVIFVPAFQQLFGTTALEFLEVATIVVIALSGFVVIEIAKTVMGCLCIRS